MAKEINYTKIVLRDKAGLDQELAVDMDRVLSAGVVKYQGIYYRYSGTSGRFMSIALFEETLICDLDEES